MANTVNKIPSINLPLTNEQGVIHPIWYEFLRSFISSVGDTGGGSGGDNTVIAGAGILGTGSVGTVNVGQGEGIVVEANSVGVDIIHQNNAQAAPEDEILIADASDQSRIRKTSLRDVANLSPGSVPGGTNGTIQYNNNGEFAGDSFFSTDGTGTVTFTGNMALGNDVHFYWPTGSDSTYGIGGEGGTPYLRGPDNTYKFETLSNGWSMGIGSGNTIIWSASTGNMAVTGLGIKMVNAPIYRSTESGIIASTVQTQGQGALNADINEVSTVANTNDTVTLPPAATGRKVTLINNGANDLQVFPASADDLGQGTNVPSTLLAGQTAKYVAYDNTNWEEQSGSSGTSSLLFETLTVTSIGF